MEERPLSGGRVTDGVVQVGDTVRRPVGSHSEFVHRLLLHLEGVGFDGAPRFLGLDAKGREVLTLLPGAPLPGTVILTDEQLRSATALLRRFHVAAASAPEELRLGCETVIHGDVGPWNIMWAEETALAFIDFDESRPGERLVDIGYFAWKGLRLNAEGPSAPAQRRRLSLLAKAYGISVDAELFAAIDAAHNRMVEKGRTEHWPSQAIEEIQAEHAWYQTSFERL